MMRLGLAFLFVTASAIACSSSNNTTTPGTGGTSATAGTTGTAGTSAGGTAGTSAGGTGGGTPGFMAVLPCPTESAYMMGATTVNFGLIDGGFNYSPKCLKVSAGTSVTFSGDFSSHPLEPSALRGTLTGNPITSTSAVPDGGTTKAFTFATPGFYAYFCQFHDSSDSGMFMSGVIWVQ
jgi:plastocyanin